MLPHQPSFFLLTLKNVFVQLCFLSLKSQGSSFTEIQDLYGVNRVPPDAVIDSSLPKLTMALKVIKSSPGPGTPLALSTPGSLTGTLSLLVFAVGLMTSQGVVGA